MFRKPVTRYSSRSITRPSGDQSRPGRLENERLRTALPTVGIQKQKQNDNAKAQRKQKKTKRKI